MTHAPASATLFVTSALFVTAASTRAITLAGALSRRSVSRARAPFCARWRVLSVALLRVGPNLDAGFCGSRASGASMSPAVFGSSNKLSIRPSIKGRVFRQYRARSDLDHNADDCEPAMRRRRSRARYCLTFSSRVDVAVTRGRAGFWGIAMEPTKGNAPRAGAKTQHGDRRRKRKPTD